MVEGTPPPFDVFLSYHWRDHAQVEALAKRIREQHLSVFLDRWYSPRGGEVKRVGNLNSKAKTSTICSSHLPEQVHLRWLRGFNIQDWCGWSRGCAGWLSWCGVAVEEFLQLLEIFLQGGEQIALMQGCGWMEEREEHEILHVEGLCLHFRDADFAF